jgi:hypothetical protein
LKRIWFNKNKRNLPIYRIKAPHKDLKEFTTTKKDLPKGINRHPTADMQDVKEDLFQVEEATVLFNDTMERMG